MSILPRPIRAVKHSMDFVNKTGELAKIADKKYLERYDVLAKKRRRELIKTLFIVFTSLLAFIWILKNVIF